MAVRVCAALKNPSTVWRRPAAVGSAPSSPGYGNGGLVNALPTLACSRSLAPSTGSTNVSSG
eukprot:1402017-Pleurochrysis_carterae.AAC.1